MSAIAFDTLKFVKQLEASGIPPRTSRGVRQCAT